jgi:hypothetical protein
MRRADNPFLESLLRVQNCTAVFVLCAEKPLSRVPCILYSCNPRGVQRSQGQELPRASLQLQSVGQLRQASKMLRSRAGTIPNAESCAGDVDKITMAIYEMCWMQSLGNWGKRSRGVLNRHVFCRSMYAALAAGLHSVCVNPGARPKSCQQ